MKYLIFGAASTLGQALIAKLLQDGHEACGVLHHDRAPELADIPYITNCDLRDASAMKALAQQIRAVFGIPDHVINCAGKSVYHDFISDRLEDWYDTFHVNFSGSVNAAYCGAQLLSENEQGGAIVLVGSGYGDRHIPYLSSYCVAKGALLPLVKTLSTELAAKRIRINLVTPGIFPSNMTKEFLANKKYTDQLIEHIPDRQYGTAQDLARIILFLTSQEARHINGAELVVDGGMLNLIEGGIVR